MIRPKQILLRLLLVAIPVLLAMAPAMAQTNSVFVGHSVELSVVEIPGDTYSWELYSDVTGINFATDAGNCPQTVASFAGGISTGPVVHVTWLSPGTYFYKVTAQRSGCTMNLKVGKIIVEHPLPTAALNLSQPETCIGQATSFGVAFTGTTPWSFTYRITKPDASTQDITVTNNSGTTAQIPFTPTMAGTYTFEVISVTDAYRTNTTPSNTIQLTVNPKPASSRIYQYDPNKKK